MRIVEILGKCGAEVEKNIGVVREATGAQGGFDRLVRHEPGKTILVGGENRRQRKNESSPFIRWDAMPKSRRKARPKRSMPSGQRSLRQASAVIRNAIYGA